MKVALRICALVLALFTIARAEVEEAEVCVYGGTSAGVIAATQAARMGRDVVLIEATRHLGGMSSSGLGMTDNGSTETIGGMARDFYRRVYRFYKKEDAWRFQQRAAYVAWMPKIWGVDGARMETIKAQFLFEPRAAEAVFDDLAQEAGVRLVLGERLDLKNGVQKEGAAIVAIRMESGREFRAKMFIDATYEGDLLARAGVRYVVGRESNDQYGETLNGAFPFTPAPFAKIDPFVVPGDPKSGLLPRIEAKPPGPKGAADHRVQAYNFRICLTDVPENRVPFTKPAAYNPLDYELLARHIANMKNVKPGPRKHAAIGLRGNGGDLGINFELVPNRKTDSNSGSEFGSDLTGRSYDWAEADYAKRKALWEEHKNYTQGLMWFLATDPRLPQEVRTEMQRWGWAKDEFADNDHFPRQLYVREARRMVSDYVVTEHEARGVRVAEDSVALGSYPLDSHGVTLYIDETNKLWRERGFYVGIKPYPISYRALRPRAEECTNLLVPGCLSASHAAYGSLRMEPVFMMLGQAAGTAASLAIERGVTVQELPYEPLRDRLLADKQILDRKPPADAPVDPTVQLASDLDVLLERKIIDSTEYWLANARKDAECEGERVAPLLMKMAATFEPAPDAAEAVRILATNKVIASPAFWTPRVMSGASCPGYNVRVLIRNFVRKTKR